MLQSNRVNLVSRADDLALVVRVDPAAVGSLAVRVDPAAAASQVVRADLAVVALAAE
jgi:hypothetical protein